MNPQGDLLPVPYEIGYQGNVNSMPSVATIGNIASPIGARGALKASTWIKLLLVIDACNSGQALESQEARRGQ